MSKLGRSPLLLIVASYPFVSACICTLIGGQGGLILDVEVTGGTLPAGDYAIVARVGAVEVRLDETLNQGGGAATTGVTPEAVGDGNRLFLQGVVFSQSGMITVGYREGRGPAEVTIEVWRGAVMLAQETYMPRYSESRPNGEHCPPALEQARDHLVIAAPTT